MHMPSIVDQQVSIVSAASDLFMRYGIRSVSMDDISIALGISKKTLYQLVPNKDELLSQVIDFKRKLDIQLMDDIQLRSNNALHEMVQMAELFLMIMKELKPTFLHDLKKYYALQWSEVQKFHDQELRMRIKSNIDRGIEEGYYRQDIDSGIVSRLYVNAAWSLTNEVMVTFDNIEWSRLNRQHILYHIYGLLATKGHEHLKDYKFFQDEN